MKRQESVKQNLLRQRARSLQAKPLIVSETPTTQIEPGKPTKAQNSPLENSAEALGETATDDTWLYMLFGSLILLIGVSVAIVVFVKKRYMNSTGQAEMSADASLSSGGSHSASSSGYIDISNGSSVEFSSVSK